MHTHCTKHHPLSHGVNRLIQLLERIPHSLIAFIARFSIAAVFWKSGQTKVEGLAIDLFSGTFELGVPRLADSTIPLFQSEYRVPLLSPNWPRTWRHSPSICSRCCSWSVLPRASRPWRCWA